MGDLAEVAETYFAAADDATDRMMALGSRPNDPTEVSLWQMRVDRFYSQSTTLRRIGTSLNNLDAQAKLDDLSDKMSALKKATVKAEGTIKKIESINAAMAQVAKLITLGAALVEFAANPALAGAEAVKTALKGLSSD